MPKTPPPVSREKKRIETAILKSIEVSGKFFCFHDWTYIGPSPRTSILDWGSYCLCVKCGKDKVLRQMPIEPIS